MNLVKIYYLKNKIRGHSIISSWRYVLWFLDGSDLNDNKVLAGNIWSTLKKRRYSCPPVVANAVTLQQNCSFVHSPFNNSYMLHNHAPYKLNYNSSKNVIFWVNNHWLPQNWDMYRNGRLYIINHNTSAFIWYMFQHYLCFLEVREKTHFLIRISPKFLMMNKIQLYSFNIFLLVVLMNPSAKQYLKHSFSHIYRRLNLNFWDSQNPHLLREILGNFFW